MKTNYKFNVGDKVFYMAKLFLMLNYFHFKTFDSYFVETIKAANEKGYSTRKNEMVWDWNSGYNQHHYGWQKQSLHNYSQNYMDVHVPLSELPELTAYIQTLFDDFVAENLTEDQKQVDQKKRQIAGLKLEIKNIEAGNRSLIRGLTISDFIKERRAKVSEMLGIKLKDSEYPPQSIECKGKI